MNTGTDAIVDQGLRIAISRMEKAERRSAKYARLLHDVQSLRPILLKQYGAVPECVLEFCNKARSILSEDA